MNADVTIYFFDGPEVKTETVALNQLPAISGCRTFWRPCVAAFQAAVESLKGFENQESNEVIALRGNLMKERARLNFENPCPMTLIEFYRELQRHDWFYHFSDDHSVWCRGEAESSRMATLSKITPEHEKLFGDFYDYHFSGESFGKPKAPYPKLPI